MNRGNSHHGCLVKELDGSMVFNSFILYMETRLVNYLFLLELIVHLIFFFFIK